MANSQITKTGWGSAKKGFTSRFQNIALLCTTLLLASGMLQAACLTPSTNPANLSGDLSDGVCATAPPTTVVNINNLTKDITPAAGDSGLMLTSQGGDGGSGETLPIHGTNGSGAGGGLPLALSVFDSSYSIGVLGDYARGIYASSIGGTGGDGGDGFGIGIIIPVPPFFIWLPGFGGNGGNGGAGGAVTIFNNTDISTTGSNAQGIYAGSRGGRGGDGGWGVGLYGEGGDGGYGGVGGNVTLTNNGQISTLGYESHGLFAESVGGAGGDGGSGWGVFGNGADGGGNADAGSVSVTNTGFIETYGERASSIYAWSIGGGENDGGGSGGIFSWGGDGAAAGHGNTVTVNNSGSLVTRQSEASAIYAESLGGGGGNGGNSGSVGSYLSVSVGGSGGPGGNGGTTTVTTSNNMITTGEDNNNPGQWNPLVRHSHGIFASSKGGGGGHGGFAFSVAASDTFSASLAFGGSGGDGGDGGNVTLDSNSTLATYGDESHAVFAQSVGGGGGDGGFAFAGSLGGNGSLSVAFGGTGGSGGDGSIVNVDSENAILTHGIGSYGIFAQSIGGGGGSGGDSISISGSGVASGALSMGGDGGGGGHGGLLIFDGTNFIRQGVSVNSSSEITTKGDTSHGILAQSVGGGGGDGGMAISGSFASTLAAAVALGGGGGTGGDGGTVNVLNSGDIVTSGYKANGIYAQSTGKGGGNGGMSVTGTITFSPKGSAGVGVSLGGSGGGGGKGDNISVVNDGTVITSGNESSGIKAQSVGGGGGDGGFSFAGGISGPKSLNAQVAIGGSGGAGNTGGVVDVINNGPILTSGFLSHGILAESVGGGGGTGGSSITATLGLVDKTVGVGVSLGGSGGVGGFGQLVSVTNNESITTLGNGAYGIFAQSVGGGGGAGGAAYSGSAALSHPDSKFNMNVNVAIGGSGGIGGHGGTVDIANTDLIETWGINAHGIYGQSVGGGGGVGGSARTMSLTQCWWECSPKNVSLSLSMGGAGGAAGNGGIVTISNDEDIRTHSTDSHGIWAQSVGGGGGNGGDGAHGFWGVPTIGASKTTPYLDVNVSMGGSQGASGDGGNVTVVNDGRITTLEDGSFGVYAQSVGGGGGHGGHGAIGITGKVGVGGKGGAAGNGGDASVTINGDIDTSGGAAHGIFAQSVGGGGGLAGNIERGLGNDINFGIGVGITKNGGNGGNGGEVAVASSGNIITRGQGSIGIFAQSVGGGGGLAGDNGTGFAFSGSAGGDGAGGAVTVNHSGNITTLGDNSHGIFAQSGGGTADIVPILDAAGNIIGFLTDSQDLAGNIDITLDGELSANGIDSNGIFLQSKGDDGNGNISVSVNNMVHGGSGDSAGVRVLDGAINTLNINGGTVTTLDGVDGTAVFATSGSETINNSGTVIGSVTLGAGSNSFKNLGGSLFSSGTTFDLGGGAFSNAGTFSPGGAERVLTTDLVGSLSQAGSGNYALDYDFDGIEADLVNVSGVADLSGDVSVSELNLGYAKEGSNEETIISASSLSQSGLRLVTVPSAILSYELLYPNETDLVLSSTIDFTPDSPQGTRLKRNQRALGRYIADIQAAGGSAQFAPVAEALILKPDFESLASAYDMMIPAHFLNMDIATIYTSQNFHNAMLSCPQRAGAHRFLREGDCNWMSIGYNELDYEDDEFTGSFLEKTWSVSGGMQRPLNEKWVGGFGVSLEQTDLDSNDNASSEGNRVQAGLAFKRRSESSMVATAVSVGYGSYDSKRVVNLPVDGITASSDQDIWFGAAQLRVSQDYEYGDWYLRPSLEAGVTYVNSGGFTEKGAGGASLHVKSHNHTVFSITPTIEVGGEIHNEGTLLRPYAKLGMKFYSDTDVDLSATLDGAPVGVAPFKTEGRLDNVVATVSAGVNIVTQEDYSLRIGYTGQFSDRVENHGAMIKLSIPF